MEQENIFGNINVYIINQQNTAEQSNLELVNLDSGNGPQPNNGDIESLRSKRSKPDKDRVLNRFKSKVLEFGTKVEQEERKRLDNLKNLE